MNWLRFFLTLCFYCKKIWKLWFGIFKHQAFLFCFYFCYYTIWCKLFNFLLLSKWLKIRHIKNSYKLRISKKKPDANQVFWDADLLIYLLNRGGRYCEIRGFRYGDDYFRINFDHFWNKHHFFSQLVQKQKSIRTWNRTTISKLT